MIRQCPCTLEFGIACSERAERLQVGMYSTGAKRDTIRLKGPALTGARKGTIRLVGSSLVILLANLAQRFLMAGKRTYL